MVFKTFVFNIVIRVVVMSLTIVTFFYLIFKTEYYTSCLLIGLFVILQVLLMIRYVARTNKYVTSFLEAIKYSEFTRSFEVEGLGSSFDKMKQAFNSVIKEFQKIRDEKEQQYFFFVVDFIISIRRNQTFPFSLSSLLESRLQKK